MAEQTYTLLFSEVLDKVHKAKTKSLGKKITDVGKAATIPVRFLLNIKSKPDSTEKFATSNMTPKQKVSSAISNYKSGMKMEDPMGKNLV